MAGTGVFVGREGELSRLRSALAERARLVLVVGDAGIGKTRFVSEGLARAADGGMLTVGGGCLPLAEKLPLLPIADALGGLSRLGGGAPFEVALEAVPAYVRSEVARLLPKLAADEPAANEPVEAWRNDRLFAGVAELLDGVARRSQLALLVEDVHWADTATLDFLTYLTRAVRADPVIVVVTCRSDEVPLDAAVADWLSHVRRDAGVEEIRLGPLSPAEVAEQVAALMGTGPPPGGLVAEVYARAEGHPFFTEQLVAAAVSDSEQLAPPAALPARLAELLIRQTAHCHADARAVLAALAVAGRPLGEGPLSEVTGLDPDTVRAAVRELTAARLLAPPADGGHRPRHGLLAEALAAELLPDERVSLHAQVAGALETVGGEELAAEAAGHWAAAGRTAEELQARLTAARVAERVFAYADAATHWQRAIELCQAEPGAGLADGIDVPDLYIHAVDALDASGATLRAAALAEEAYGRFADHPDRATAAKVHFRAASGRAIDSLAAGLPLMKEALRLFEGTAASAEHAQAWADYAYNFLMQSDEPRSEEIMAAHRHGLEIAEEADAAPQRLSMLSGLAYQSFVHGEVEEGFRLIAQARERPEALREAWAGLGPAIIESDALLKVGRLEEATRVGLHGFDVARQLGLESNVGAALVLANAVEGLLSRGRAADATALIDPRTGGQVERDRWLLHQARAEIDLLRGEVDAAVHRLDQIEIRPNLEWAREYRQCVAEVALWAGRPQKAVEEARRGLEAQGTVDRAILCGWLLAAGMRACADIAERARAHCDDDALVAALAGADNLAAWVDRANGAPFTDHPFVVTIPAARATWDAERTRASGASDPAAWSVAAERWEALGYRHRAGYARWRQAEALLTTPHGSHVAAAAVLATAADRAREHVPLITAIEDLARRARIDLDTVAEPVQPDEPPTARAFGLSDRELDVLRLLGQGKTNPEIAAALFISPRTAGVHVTHILRKLDATTRVQAATIADRAGLLGPLV
jgi:DNA-binding CsgD family transcriptional regulator